MRALSIEFLSVFGLPPVELIRLAAALGCQQVSVADWFMDYNPHGYAPYSIRDDAALRREMKAAMADTGVTVSTGEGCFVHKSREVADYAADIAAFAELGAPRINTLSYDRDLGRSIDKFGHLAELAASFGLATVVEFIPGMTVGSLATAVEVARQVGRSDFGLVIDAMHLGRSGATPADLAAVDPALIAYAQICDCPMTPRFDTYGEEAGFERMCPGAGELPLKDFVRALPAGMPLGLEIPMRAKAEAGVGPHDRLKPCVNAARALLAEVD
jgi:sugar phosphate isomerase/epimerase